jgi:phosphomannomutase
MKRNEHVEAYAHFLADKAKIARPLTVVCDSSNGPTSLVLENLKGKIPSLHITVINGSIDPDFPAHGPDPSAQGAVEAIARKIIEIKADLGVIFDGDGDRAVFVDETGMPVPSDATALFLIKNTPGTHVADTIIYQMLTHLDPAFREKVMPSKVGRYFINKAMHEHGAVIGAEFSGHFFFKEFFGADSGIFTMIMVLNLLSLYDIPASKTFRQAADHTVVASKVGLSKPFTEFVRDIKAYLATKKPSTVSDTDGLTIDFGESWINMRPSNTEPIVRITAGAKDPIIARSVISEYEKILSWKI